MIMKKIAVLIDLTEGSKVALRQGKILAEKNDASIVVIHIAHDEVPDEIHHNILDGFVKPVVGQQIDLSYHIGRGDFMSEIPNCIITSGADFVVLCTHGIKGIAQNLFGAHVLKLVQSIQVPCLVVQEGSFVADQGMEKLLLPASPFDDFDNKMKACAAVAKGFGAEVVYYEIDKYLGDTEEAIAKNGAKARDYMLGQGIPFKAVLEDNKDRSLGHAQQTINYAHENRMNLICLSSHTHQEYMAMGKADKEKFLTNDKAIPVLCCG
jgi:nucleotide-binding universal stress UspA family protein